MSWKIFPGLSRKMFAPARSSVLQFEAEDRFSDAILTPSAQLTQRPKTLVIIARSRSCSCR